MNIIKTILKRTLALGIVLFILCDIVVGAVLVFQSFFFDTTWKQTTWPLMMQHAAMCFAGLLLIAIAISILKCLVED